jgi:hypothetical protein
VTALKKIKGIGKATLHGEPSEQAVYNSISYIVRTLGAKDGLELIVLRRNSNEQGEKVRITQPVAKAVVL